MTLATHPRALSPPEEELFSESHTNPTNPQREFVPIARLYGDSTPVARPHDPRGSRGFCICPRFQPAARERALCCHPSPVPAPRLQLAERPWTLAAQKSCCNFLAQAVILTNILAARERGGSQPLSV